MEVIINSMTKEERAKPEISTARVERVSPPVRAFR